MSCGHDLCLGPEDFHRPRKKPCAREAVPPAPSYPQSLGTTGLLSVSVGPPILDSSHKGSHITCSVMWLLLACVVKVPPCCSMCQISSFYSLCGQTMLRLSICLLMDIWGISTPSSLLVKVGSMDWQHRHHPGACCKCRVSGPPPRNDRSELAVSQDHWCFKFEKHCLSPVILSLKCSASKPPMDWFSFLLMLSQWQKYPMSVVWLGRCSVSTKTRAKLITPLQRLAA